MYFITEEVKETVLDFSKGTVKAFWFCFNKKIKIMINVKLSNSQLNKLKFAIKDETEVTLNLSSNLIGNSNDETNFPHKLLLTNTEVSKIR